MSRKLTVTFLAVVAVGLVIVVFSGWQRQVQARQQEAQAREVAQSLEAQVLRNRETIN